MSRLGSAKPFSSTQNTNTFGSFTAVTTYSAATYGSWVESVSAASNTADRYLVGVGVYAYEGTAPPSYTGMPIYVKIGIGGAGAESAIATDIPVCVLANASTSAAAAGHIALVPALAVSSGTRIAVASRQRSAPAGNVSCVVTLLYALSSAIEVM